MVQKNKYISLKQAAKLSGYSADYIGYLIRAGKIHGRPIYTNITWQTTAEEVLTYKAKKTNNGKNLSLKEKFFFKLRKSFIQEINILKLFFKTFRFLIPMLVILILSFSLLLGFVFSRNFGRKEILKSENIEKTETFEEKLIY